MEFPSIWFFSISYIISSISCAIGLCILMSSVSDSGHPLSVIKYAIAYFMSSSIFNSATYAFLIRPQLENPQSPRTSTETFKFFCVAFIPPLIVLVLFTFLPGILAAVITPSIVLSYNSRCGPIISISDPKELYNTLCLGILSAIFAVLAVIYLGFSGHVTVLCYISYIIVPLVLLPYYTELKERFVMLGTSVSLMWIYRRRKYIQFTIGMVFSILFQFFLRMTSTIQILAFFCLVVAWPGILAMVQPSTDLGIFTFLLVNACLSCTVNIFKLRGYTWLAFGVCILLYVLRCKLVIVELSYDRFFWLTRPRDLTIRDGPSRSRYSSRHYDYDDDDDDDDDV